MDILEVVCKNREYNLYESINWICIQLNIDNSSYGFATPEAISDWEFINGYQKSKKKNVDLNKELAVCDSSILNIFQHWYSKDWIDEGISIKSMIKYGIQYCTLQQRIIIPHYDISNKLIGVRTRALLDDDIERFGKYAPFQLQGQANKYNHQLSQNLYGLNINKTTIRNKQKVMLVEAEKGVLQADTMFGDDNFTLALCGNSLSNYQRDILIMLGVKEVIVALDKQYESLDSEEAKKWANHIKTKIIKPLSPYMSVYVLWDTENLLNYKDSPVDHGKETLIKLMKNKIYVNTDM